MFAYCKAVRLAKITMVGAMLTACGPGGDESPVPPGSTVRVSPSNVTWNITPVRDINSNPICVSGRYNDHTFSISVENSSGQPLGEVDLRIRIDLAANTSSTNLMQLYDDLNGNGVIDDPAELVSGPGSVFFTKTSRYSGEKTVMVRVNTSCTYGGDLTVNAGAAFGSAHIEVQEQQGGA